MNSTTQFQVSALDRKGGWKIIEGPPPEDIPEDDTLLYWIHLDYNQEHALKWILQAEWLDSIVKENLLDEKSRPRSERINDGLFLALRGVNLNPGSEPDDMVAVRLWATEKTIITSNHRRLLSLQYIRDLLSKGKGPDTASTFIALLIEAITQRNEDVIEDLEDRLEFLEDNLDTLDKENKAKFSDLRRQAIRLRRYLSPQQESLQHLITTPPDWLQKNCKKRIRECSYQLKRHVEMLDSIRERAIVAQEELLAQLSEALSHRMYILSLVTALFLPLSFLTGLFGINVGGIPGAKSTNGFLLFCLLVIVLLGFLLAFFKKKKWL
ncbi:zinc transporter ZntB [Desulfogranum japonicum]|uniref:zinc transporter ZntB n=1 Tax=Desulfogranum japonicum TaxID=231447 RepID=UPI0003F96EF2|nr:zinc transporter ZntB [Desulfogranum japonicum]